MPMDYAKYPMDWKAISARIRERAGHQCEECGVPNGAIIYRKEGSAAYITDPAADLRGEYNVKATKVVLTVHHIGMDKPDGTPGDPRDKMDCRNENLQALCQRCHLLADMALHIENAKRTRDQKRRNKARRIA